ncbi:hypothetical protein [Flavobacterium psychrotrophum]|uniref:hypothetical protein n=1 Tax=Flavobacterium psychrotrophum TaxID=2294119 RepID=UPI000E3138A4|nr:hypothetical protein [Flavobacterium psychrotrophum]
MKMKSLYIACIILLVVNCLELYLIIELSGYAELVSYGTNGELLTESPYKMVIVCMVTGVSNLLFIAAIFMRSIIFSDVSKV